MWDYYYKNAEVHDQKDKNSDFYQTYYNGTHTYTGYPLLSAAKPYIIGLPGQTYYEFDLSGNFIAKNTAVAIDKLGKQSVSGTTKNYTLSFKPSYMNTSLAAGTNNYTLDADGDSYDKVPTTGDATKVSAFRPYFTATATAKPSQSPKRILLGGDQGSLEGELQSGLNGDLEIYSKDRKIITTSHLKEATTISIISVSGVTIANYVLMPGETKETPIHVDGVYIVNKNKLYVK